MKLLASIVCVLSFLGLVAGCVGPEPVGTVIHPSSETAFTTNKASLALVGREYQILSSVETNLSRVATEIGITVTNRPDWQKIFEELGVGWPKGSFIQYDLSHGKLLLTNTLANVTIIEAVLAACDHEFRNIAVDLQLLEFSREDIEAILRKQDVVDMDSLNRLRARGRAKLLCAPRVETRSGEEASLKLTADFVYPTEFKVPIVTNCGTLKVTGVMEPGGFETKQVGATLQVCPTFCNYGDGIDLILTPEVIDEPVWRTYGPSLTDKNGRTQRLNIRQPFFHARSVAASLHIANGSTALFAGGMNSRDNARMAYVLLKACVLDPDGKPDLFPFRENPPFVHGASECEMVTWIYHMPNIESIRLSTRSASDDERKEIERELKEFFTQFGVKWPEGSSLRYVKSIHKLIIKNTPENQEILERCFEVVSFYPVLMTVAAQHIEFQRHDVDTIIRRQGSVSQSELRKLWRAGKGKLLYAPQFLVRSGQESVIKTFTKYCYPTVFTCVPVFQTNDLFTVGLMDAVVESGVFEARDVGLGFQVTPTASPELNMVDLIVNLGTAYDPIWKDYGSGYIDSDGNHVETRIEMPFFQSHSINSKVSVLPGSSILIGGALSQQNSENLVYVFAGATLVDEKGRMQSDLSVSNYPVAGSSNTSPKGMSKREFHVSLAGWRANMDKLMITNSESIRAVITKDDPIRNNASKELLKRHGVKWPVGSSLSCLPPIGERIVVVNSARELASISKILIEMGVVPCQVSVEADFVAFKPADVEVLLKEKKAVDAEGLLRLLGKGKGELLSCPKIVTVPGQSAVIQGGSELIYPTVYKLSAVPSSGTNGPLTRGVVEPRDFMTQDMGVYLEVTPTLQDGNGKMIDLSYKISDTGDLSWMDDGSTYTDSYGVKNILRMLRPIFRTTNFESTISIANGETVVMGGGARSSDGSMIIYALVTAELVDMKGEPLLPRDR